MELKQKCRRTLQVSTHFKKLHISKLIQPSQFKCFRKEEFDNIKFVFEEKYVLSINEGHKDLSQK